MLTRQQELNGVKAVLATPAVAVQGAPQRQAVCRSRRSNCNNSRRRNWSQHYL